MSPGEMNLYDFLILDVSNNDTEVTLSRIKHLGLVFQCEEVKKKKARFTNWDKILLRGPGEGRGY